MTRCVAWPSSGPERPGHTTIRPPVDDRAIGVFGAGQAPFLNHYIVDNKHPLCA